jgi:hypothetical protein
VRYTVRRERRLMAPLDDHVRCRWCVGRHVDAPLWDPTTVTQNRERWLAGDVAPAFFEPVLAQARAQQRLAAAHVPVDGTWMEAWAGQQSVQSPGAPALPAPPDAPGNPSSTCRGARRTHATHASTTAPAARLDKQATGQEANRCDLGPVLRANRHGGVVDTQRTQATGTAEREAARARAEEIPGPPRGTRGGARHDETQAFVSERREVQVTPPVAPHTTGRTRAIDGRTTRHPGDPIRQQQRKPVDESCAWLKTVGLRRTTRHRGMARVGWMCTCAAAVSNLGRRRTLVAVACASADNHGHGTAHTPLRPPSGRGQGRIRPRTFRQRAIQRFCPRSIYASTGVFQQPARTAHAVSFTDLPLPRLSGN